MSFIPPVMEIIKDNILRKGNPLGLPPKLFTAWAKDLDLPRSGDTFIYTGLEYQMLPYNDRFLEIVKQAGAFGERMAIAGKIKGMFDRFGLDLTKVFASAKNADRYNAILRQFAAVFRSVNINAAYLYEDEPYAGALLYEFGYLDELKEMGKRLNAVFSEKGVKRLIVISPHSLEMFKKIYPGCGIQFDFEIVHYLEALKDFTGGKLDKPKEVSIHDPCHLARSLGIIQEPRDVLAKVEGCSVREIPHSNKLMTSCCGAPIESYLPHLGQCIAKNRLSEFEKAGFTSILTVCPFCYHNLSSQLDQKSAVTVQDFIEVIHTSTGGVPRE